MTVTEPCFAVSVVICAYNAEKYIEKSLRSICEQTYRNLEIIVIDDASTDSTASIAEALVEKDERIRVIRLKSNGGIAHARQVGLESVCHHWLLFLDADDIALPTMIERQVSLLRQDENIIGVSTYSYVCTDDEDEIIGVQRVGIPSRDEFFVKYAGQKLMFIFNNTLFSKQHALAVGGYRLDGFPVNSSVRYQDFSEDVDLWCRLSDFGSEGKYLVTVSEPLFKYRKTTGSLSTSNIFKMQEKMRWIKDCLKHRRSGLPERSFEEFRQSIKTMQKLDNLRSDYAALTYRKMGFLFMGRCYIRAVLLFAIVCFLKPKFAMQKLKTQKRVS